MFKPAFSPNLMSGVCATAIAVVLKEKTAKRVVVIYSISNGIIRYKIKRKEGVPTGHPFCIILSYPCLF